MKIALFSPSLRSGGAERVVSSLAKGFLRRGHEAQLVLADATFELLAEIPHQVQIVNLGKKRISHCLIPLIRYLRKEKPDIFLSSQTHVNTVASLAFWFLSVPTKLVLVEHTTLGIHLDPSYSRGGRLMLQLGKIVYRRADAIVAVSDGVAHSIEEILRIPKSLVHVIYNPVPGSEIEVKARHQISYPWFAPGELPVILAVGRMTAAKDYPTLLRAFSLLTQGRAARLLILGEGEERQTLEKLIVELDLSQVVSMPGHVPGPYAYMARCAVFVLSSVWEGFGIVLVEALLCGATIVSTDCPSGPAEILGNGRYGMLVPVGDAPALASALKESLDHKRDPSVQRARAHEFSEEKAVDKYLALFHSLVEE